MHGATRSADPGDPGWLAFEQQCLERARRGDAEAFGALYRAFAAPLYRQILLPRLGSPALAEEALADTFCTALAQLGRFEERGVSVWYWLVRVAANKATDVLRRQSAAGRALVRMAGLLEPLGEPAAGPEGALDHAERQLRLRQRVAEVLARGNPRYRTALELRFLQDRSRTECAAALALKLGTFDVLLLRALKAFRREWLAGPGSPASDRAPGEEGR